MYSINNLSLEFTGIRIFDDVSLLINKKDRVGLVGKNGAGKTTLLRIFSGSQILLESGTLAMPADTSIGFLPQEILFKGTKSVFEETLMAFKKIISLRETIKRNSEFLETSTDFASDDYAQCIQELNNANEQYQLLGGHQVDAETERILTGLGFGRDQIRMPITSFSGGWRMRIELAKILLRKPDLLLLDEPTNHLDIESIQWLEDFLLKYPGAVVIVSHDRTFLDNVTNRTIELNMGKLFDYDVPYTQYIIRRDERISQQQATFENQQKFIQENEKFIERFRYKASKAKQVQSRVKMLNKLDVVEVDEIDSARLFFHFPPAPSSGKIVVEVERLNKSYDTKNVLHNIDLLIDKGDKIAFVGKNGEGKTTLSRIIAGDLDYEGTCQIGYNVSLGYYAQNETELLNPDKSVFETIDDVAVGDIRKKVRNILGAFLFGGDTIDKKVKVLSGGEKSRLALAKLLLNPINLLILDEPTNHLDMKAKDILKQALMRYDGTLIIVSHDRHFLQGLTNKVFEFKDKKIKQFNGDVIDFLNARRIENLKALEVNQKIQITAPKPVSDNKILREKRKESEKEIRKVQNAITKLESIIEVTEKEISRIENVLSKPEDIPESEDYRTIYITHLELKKKYDNHVDDWSVMHEKLEKLKVEQEKLK